MVTKHIETLSHALKYKKFYVESYLKRIIIARKRTIYLLEYRFGFKPYGWVGEEENPIILYDIKGSIIGYPTHRVTSLPFLGAKQHKEYTKPTAKQVTNSVNYLEKFLTKYGNSIHKMNTNQFNQFRKIVEGTI